jgi:chemotaxis protein histidine kinase CheA
MTRPDNPATAWETTFRRLRSQYVRNGAERVTRIESALAALAVDRADPETLADLHREFHSLAGSGRIYGLADLSDIGRAAARDVFEFIRHRASPSDSDIERWRDVGDRIRAEFGAAGEG